MSVSLTQFNAQKQHHARAMPLKNVMKWIFGNGFCFNESSDIQIFFISNQSNLRCGVPFVMSALHSSIQHNRKCNVIAFSTEIYRRNRFLGMMVIWAKYNRARMLSVECDIILSAGISRLAPRSERPSQNGPPSLAGIQPKKAPEL